ncbi:MAG: DUF4116 domain-containing protein [Bacilli bacterium]|nr:DUF4116 domain-containing protein [Bacilli bacterium]
MNDYTGIEFLDKLYQNLYKSDEVQHTKENTDNRKEAIQKYMDRLERIHKKADTETKKELLYSLYFDKYVIKEENIPYGMDKEAIINAQKKSLGMWLDYLSDETTDYPTWAKYWAFQGMLKMGSYDEAKEVYLKRDKKTIAPFVSANPEIIAKSIETISKLVKGEEVTTDTLEKINKMDSFNKICSLFEKKYKQNIVDKTSTEGVWKKYNQGSREDAIKLSKSLENMNTGWCTASEDMAIKQVCGPYSDAPNGGDFYVYYTKDEKNNYTIPRIAIRLINKTDIAEIRGIEDGQNVEEKMIEIIESKLKEMDFLSKGSSDIYLQKIKDLKQLTLIGKKTENGEELSEFELEDLYSKKYGFGWNQEQKVYKIRGKRNIIEDYNRITNKRIKVDILSLGRLPENAGVDDKEIIMEALDRKVGYHLESVSEKIKKDRQFIIEVLKEHAWAITNVSQELQNDRSFILEAVKQNGNILVFLSGEFRNDKEIVLAAVKQYGCALKYASEELKNDKEVVLEAVKQDGWALEYASDELKNDKNVVLQVVKTGWGLEWASYELRNDKEVVLEAIKANPAQFDYASDELKNDKEVKIEYIKENERHRSIKEKYYKAKKRKEKYRKFIEKIVNLPTTLFDKNNKKNMGIKM